MFPDLRQPAKWISLFALYMLCAVVFVVAANMAGTDKRPGAQTEAREKAQNPARTFSGQSAAAKPKPSVQPAQRDYVKLEVTATGYTAGPESTGKSVGHPEYGITYSGVKVRRGPVSTIAADPDVFPIGTVLYIPKYGYGIVADTGSAIKGNKIDLFFETKEEVYSLWGKKDVHVLLIQTGNGTVTERMVDQLNETISRKGHLLDIAF